MGSPTRLISEPVMGRVRDRSLCTCAQRKFKCCSAMSSALLCRLWLSVTSYVFLTTLWHMFSVVACCMYSLHWLPLKLPPWWAWMVMFFFNVLSRLAAMGPRSWGSSCSCFVFSSVLSYRSSSFSSSSAFFTRTSVVNSLTKTSWDSYSCFSCSSFSIHFSWLT